MPCGFNPIERARASLFSSAPFLMKMGESGRIRDRPRLTNRLKSKRSLLSRLPVQATSTVLVGLLGGLLVSAKAETLAAPCAAR